MDSPILITKEFTCLGFKVNFKAENIGHVVLSGDNKKSIIFKLENNIIKVNNLRSDSLQEIPQLFLNGHRVKLCETDFDKNYKLKYFRQKVLSLNSFGKSGPAIQELKINSSHSNYVFTNFQLGKPQYILLYHNWNVTIKKIDSLNIKDSSFFISGNPILNWNPIDKNTCYQILNAEDLLSHKNCGDYLVDQNGNLIFKPKFINDIHTLDNLIAPSIDQLLVIRGDKENRISDFTFEGIDFEYTKLKSINHEPCQAAANENASIKIDFANNIIFKNCSIKHTGNYGIWFDSACNFCNVNHCEFGDLGAGGIKIGDVGINSDNITTKNIIINNNIIEGCGKLIPEAVGILITQSSSNQITHNDISDLYYSGISVGWVWGYGTSFSYNNLIAFNNIHHIGWGRLSDMAGIYTLGISNDTRILNNCIHDVACNVYGANGIYTDEGTSNVLIMSNVVYNAQSASFYQHYGKNNIVRNNIFLNATQNQLICARVEKHQAFELKNNIIIWEKGNLFSGPWNQIDAIIDSNIYYKSTGNEFPFLSDDFSKWKALGHDFHSFVSNPFIHFIPNKRISFSNKKLLDIVNFSSIDLRQIGLSGNLKWKSKPQIDKERTKEFEKLIE